MSPPLFQGLYTRQTPRSWPGGGGMKGGSFSKVIHHNIPTPEKPKLIIIITTCLMNFDAFTFSGTCFII